jgi:hypothetical protein
MGTVNGVSTGFAGVSGDFSYAGMPGFANVYKWSLSYSAPAIKNTVFNPSGGATTAVLDLNTFTGQVHAYVDPGHLPTNSYAPAVGIFTTHGAGFPNSGGTAQSISGNFLITGWTIDETVNANIVGLVANIESTGPIGLVNGS